MKYTIGILALFLVISGLIADDPPQPKVGGTQVIVATNGYSGTINVRTQVNVGYPNQAGLIQISSTNGTYVLSLFVTPAGLLTISNNTTLVGTVAASSGYSGSGTKFLSDNGTYQSAGGGTSGGGGGDTVWTNNNASIVTLLPTESQVNITPDNDVDGTPVLIVDTTNPHSFDNIVVFKNEGTNLVQFGADGFNQFSGVTPALIISQEGNGLAFLQPTLSDGNTPYVFDTSVTHATGNLVELNNNGTNSFTVAAISGYTGSGTLFLSDDGTYKPGGGGGGDTIWTNLSGIVEIIGVPNIALNTNGIITLDNQVGDNSELTPTALFIRPGGNDLTVLTPNIADGTTPYIFDTSVPHTTGDFFIVKNGGVPILSIDGNGKFDLESAPNSHAGALFNVSLSSAFSGQGLQVIAYDGGFTGTDMEALSVENYVPITNATKIIYFKNGLYGAELSTFTDGDYTGQSAGVIGIAEGGTSTQIGAIGYAQARNNNQINVGIVGTASLDEIGGGALTGTTGTGGYFEVLTTSASNSDPVYSSSVIQLNNRDSSVPHINAGDNNSMLFQLYPSAPDGTTPYTLDTSVAHTTGNLVEINNNGTNSFTISAVSGYTGAGTLFLSDDGTFKTVSGGGINPTSGRLPYNNAGTFDDSFLSQASQSIIENNSTGANSVYRFDNSNTNNSASTVQVFFSDSDGSGDAAEINFGKGAGWGLGDTNQRNGNITLSTLHASLLNERLTIAGDAGFTFKDRDASVTQLLVNASGLTTDVPVSATNALPFKVGQVATGVGLVIIGTNYLQIEVDGVAYKVGLVK